MSELIPFGDFKLWTVRKLGGNSEHELSDVGREMAARLVAAPIHTISPTQGGALRRARSLYIEEGRSRPAESPVQVYTGDFWRVGQPLFRGSWTAWYILPMYFTEDTEITRDRTRGLGRPEDFPARLAEIVEVARRGPLLRHYDELSTPGIVASAGAHSGGGSVDIDGPLLEGPVLGIDPATGLNVVLRTGDTLVFDGVTYNLTKD